MEASLNLNKLLQGKEACERDWDEIYRGLRLLASLEGAIAVLDGEEPNQFSNVHATILHCLGATKDRFISQRKDNGDSLS